MAGQCGAERRSSVRVWRVTRRSAVLQIRRHDVVDVVLLVLRTARGATVRSQVAQGHQRVLVFGAAREQRLDLGAVAGETGHANVDVHVWVEDRICEVRRALVRGQVRVAVREHARIPRARAAGGHDLHQPVAMRFGLGPTTWDPARQVRAAVGGVVEARLAVDHRFDDHGIGLRILLRPLQD